MLSIYVFPVVIYRWESWTIKKAECRKIDTFKLWCWRRLLRVRWTAKKSNQSILKEINPAYSLEGLMLETNTLATWCEQLTHWKRLQCTERLKAEGEEGDRGWNGWMASQVQWMWIWANSGSWLGTGKPGMLQCVGLWRVGHDLVTEQQQQFVPMEWKIIDHMVTLISY